MASHAPDSTLVIRDDKGLRARASLWWSDAPPLPGHKVGAIGHYGAADAEASALLLAKCCRLLAERGCTIAVGPMDGNTWRRYRLIVERGSEPTFFLEPDNPDAWPLWWRDAGFGELAGYYSSLNDDLSQRDPRAAQVAPRLAANGITMRELDPSR